MRVFDLALAVSAFCLAATQPGVFGGEALADSETSVVLGNVRFEALSDSLVRMEYSPKASFVDSASVAVIGRAEWSGASLTAKEKDGWLTVSTGKMNVSYKLGTGAFSESNVRVTWSDASGERSWRPGDKDERNLGGVPGDIAHRLVPVTDPGPLSRNGCYLLDDSRTPVWNKATDWIEPRPEKESQDWYFFVYGNDYAAMLKALTRLAGPIPMVPRYVLGSWFGSRTNYNADEWKIITERYREENIPLDVLVLDSCSWTDVVWSGYNWDYEQMPDPKGFFKWMTDNGVRVTLNEHYAPLKKESDSHFETIRAQMDLPPETKEIPHDLANNRYVDLFANLLLKPALDMGMAFWWQDGCAPANMEGLDPMMWTREVEYRKIEEMTGRRSFVFCRLGSLGSHRSGLFFSGDLLPEWETLQVLVPFNVRAGNMLVAYPTNLTGAVFGVNVDPELYVRWMQFGSFSPILWCHGIWGLRLPWEYGELGMGVCADFIRLRQRLLPYTYTMGRIAHESGMPLVRGLYLEYPDQEQAYAFSDKQYMYGRDMLVAPITENAHGGDALKDVYLPEGDMWYDYFTGAIYSGGQVLNYECPLSRMPVFVRAGAIVPMAPQMKYSSEKPLDPLTLDVYACDGKSSFRLYEDDGESLDYREGKYAWTDIEFGAEGKAGDYALKIGPAAGEFNGKITSRRHEIRLHGLLKPDSVILNDRKLNGSDSAEWLGDWNWDASARVTTVRLRDPLPTSKQIILAFRNAGTFADTLLLQKTVAFRERVRNVKQEQKLKYALVLCGQEHAKPPRAILETEKVEMKLNGLVASPKGLSTNQPDFKAMTGQILDAIRDRPFESTRTIPEKNPSCINATLYLNNIQFEPQEINMMAANLLGVELPARLAWDRPEKHFGTAPSLHIYAKLNFDSELVGDGVSRLAVELPRDSRPGWGQMPPVADANGYTRLDVFTPNPSKPEGQTFRVKGALKWEGGEVQIHRDLCWR